MAMVEEACGNPPVPSSPLGLEALFPPGSSDQSSGEESPELAALREALQARLLQYERPLVWLQRLLVWERPLWSVSVGLTLNTLFWLLSSTSLRPLFLLSVSLLGLMLLERWKTKLPSVTVQHVEQRPAQSDSVQPRLLSVPELSHHLAESYLTCCLYLQEMLQYKRQNHGKFCVMMCSGCCVLAMVGHYVPGIMISYIIVLSVLLWPLVVYHELIQRMYTGLEPILMKLDYSMKGDTEHRKHDKRKVKKESEEGDGPQAETESESEEELSCFAPTVDVKTTALAMAITDSELSDEEVSILESGGFSVSRATTPQLTDVSEDLDQQSVHSDPEEAFLRDLPDFPSVEEFPSTERRLLRGLNQGDPAEGEPLSPASLLLQHLSSPLHFVNTHFNGHVRPPGAEGGAPPGPGGQEECEAAECSLEALSQEIVSMAISTVVQNTLSNLLRSDQEEAPLSHPSTPLDSPASPNPLTQDIPSSDQDPDEEFPDDTLVPTEEEDFELLDQSELEQVDEGQGFSSEGQGGAEAPDTTPSALHPQSS